MTAELLERRVLGVVRFVNAATRSPITDRLRVSVPDALIARNARGLYVIREAAGFTAYTLAFDAPPAPPDPAPGFTLTVEDPSRRFLSRRFSFSLPRKNAPQSDPDSVFAPLDVDLYPAASAPTAANWAVLRARVQVAGQALTGLANVLVQVTPKPAGLTPQIALTDANGEALVLVPGAPPVMPTLVSEFEASVRVILDPQAVHPQGAGLPPVPDPQSIVERSEPPQPDVRVIDAADVTLAAGRTRRAVIEVPWP